MTKKKQELKAARDEYEAALKNLGEAEKVWVPARQRFDAAQAAYFKAVLG